MKNKKLFDISLWIGILSFFILNASSCFLEKIPDPVGSSFYPMKEGNRWTYRAIGDSDTITLTTEITGITKIGNHKYFIFEHIKTSQKGWNKVRFTFLRGENDVVYEFKEELGEEWKILAPKQGKGSVWHVDSYTTMSVLSKALSKYFKDLDVLYSNIIVMKEHYYQEHPESSWNWSPTAGTSQSRMYYHYKEGVGLVWQGSSNGQSGSNEFELIDFELK
jgi:hypothetical protein